jgi:hypothetical protein
MNPSFMMSLPQVRCQPSAILSAQGRQGSAQARHRKVA